MRQFIRFGMVGTMGFVVDAGALLVIVAAGAPPFSARVVSFVIAASFTFMLHHRFTFKLRTRPTASRWSYYMLLTAVGAAVNLGVYRLWIGQLGTENAHLIIGTALGSVAALSINYTVSRLLVFGTEPNPRVTDAAGSSS